MCALAVMAALLAEPCLAVVINVPGDQPTIADAIAAAVNGDEIVLAAGTFNERNLVPGSKSIAIRGQGPDQTIIDGQGIAGTILMTFGTGASTFEDLTLRNGVPGQANGGGAFLASGMSTPVFRNCRFENCTNNGFAFGAVYLQSDSASEFHQCVFTGNFSDRNGSAVGTVFNAGGSARFINCLFHANSGADRTVHRQGGSLEFVNCTAADTQDGVFTNNNGNITMTNCVMDASSTPGGNIVTNYCLFSGGSGTNIDGLPTFVNAAGDDYRLAIDSPGVDAADYDAYGAAGGGAADLAGFSRPYDYCAVADTGVGAFAYLDMGAFDAHPLVTNITAGGVEYDTIQAAIASASNGDEIELGAGVFCERDLVPGSKSIAIRGQGPDQTIIDGQGIAGTILRTFGTGASTFEDLTLRNGVPGQANGGGAFLASGMSTPVFRNCRFENCTNNGFAFGAVYLESDSASEFHQCVFTGNFSDRNGSAVGTVFNAGGSARFINCLFHANSGADRTVHRQGGSLEFVNCTTADTQDGVFTNNNGNIAMTNCAMDATSTPGGNIVTNYCLFSGGSGTNIDGLPDFRDAAGGDYRLKAGTLGIDAADYDAYAAAVGDVNELAGEPRTHDDVGTADTGLGVLTYLDLGAYEFQGTSFPGDCDGDGDVDLADYGEFGTCLLGPDGGLGAGCECFDFDADDDNDLADFAAFQLNFTGP